MSCSEKDHMSMLNALLLTKVRACLTIRSFFSLQNQADSEHRYRLSVSGAAEGTRFGLLAAKAVYSRSFYQG